jgi:hypothetical protein
MVLADKSMNQVTPLGSLPTTRYGKRGGNSTDVALLRAECVRRVVHIRLPSNRFRAATAADHCYTDTLVCRCGLIPQAGGPRPTPEPGIAQSGNFILDRFRHTPKHDGSKLRRGAALRIGR